MIAVAAFHVLQNSLPRVDGIITELAIIHEAVRVLPLDVAPYGGCILGLVATHFANNNFFAVFVNCSSHEALNLLKNS